MRLLNRARSLDDLRNPPGNRLHALKDDRAGQHSISLNPHAGEMLMGEFMEPLRLDAATLAGAIQASVKDVWNVIEGRMAMTGELDLRLARYFGMSAGFFLGLQDGYELLEAKRALAAALDRIVPRAA